MKLQATEHSYYCNDTNYHVGNMHGENFGRAVHDTWQDFKESWFMSEDRVDHDYNHCFRYDICESASEEDEEASGKFYMKLYMMHQRKGRFVPVLIKSITEEDIPEIEEYLKSCWEYLSQQW